jgi:thioredoxin reductase
VTLSYRKNDFSRMKDRNRATLTKAIQEGKVRFFPSSQVAQVSEKEVLIQCEDGRTETLPNDFIFALLGGTPPNAFLESIGVPMVTKEVSGP